MSVNVGTGATRVPTGSAHPTLLAGLLSVGAAVLIVAIQGHRITDVDLPVYLQTIARHGTPVVPPARQFLLEGVLDDAMGMVVARGRGSAVQIVRAWWLIGFAALSMTLAYSVLNRSLSMTSLFFIVAYSRMIDTLSMYIGKFDPFLLAFMILSVNRSRAAAFLGFVGAGFSHPLMALVSACGVVATEGALDRRWRLWPIAVTIVAVLGDYYLLHRLYPELSNRIGFVLSYHDKVLASGLRWGLATFISSLFLPIASILWFRPVRPLGRGIHDVAMGLWLIAATIIVCNMTLDHTRDAFLSTIAPLILFLRKTEPPTPETLSNPRAIGVLALLFMARLVIPHTDSIGAHLMYCWPPTAPS